MFQSDFFYLYHIQTTAIHVMLAILLLFQVYCLLPLMVWKAAKSKQSKDRAINVTGELLILVRIAIDSAVELEMSRALEEIEAFEAKTEFENAQPDKREKGKRKESDRDRNPIQILRFSFDCVRWNYNVNEENPITFTTYTTK